MTDSARDGGNFRRLAPGQRTVVRLAAPDAPESRKLFETTEILLEAPNWTPDGSALLLNGNGALWRLDVARPDDVEHVPLTGVPDINNDHVPAPDGRTVYVTAKDGHIYAAPITGGAATRLTEDDGWRHYLHGVSPDGRSLACVLLPSGGDGTAGELAVLPATGGPVRVLETGPGHLDGPEYTPDGEWIVFNDESFGEEPGHAQLARVPAEGGTPRRLVSSATVDWFPHVSPDGRYANYLSYPAGTLGHPPDTEVAIHVVSTADWQTPLRTFPLFGGQGTSNVGNWAPDSGRFAFVSYG
ncbi:component of the Tol biopolymer transport system [Actinopolyspora lacussalsi subsp. righensis]|uniref:Component of the Tol biopolymer transport system n=1 Tax=Actinopolyspora righensis TaxID=995060 RepID=A0A1I7AK79_9ACTN|nr:biopolymer transporter Tol [Actinopolyspora righensis]SFT75389.1 component of the Tol biopolymer transport system [Actinopolyspora righensis]